MPKFTFTSPEGKSYDVEGPDGATKEQAFGILQKQLASKPASDSKVDLIPKAQPDLVVRSPEPPTYPKTFGEKASAIAKGAASEALGPIAETLDKPRDLLGQWSLNQLLAGLGPVAIPEMAGVPRGVGKRAEQVARSAVGDMAESGSNALSGVKRVASAAGNAIKPNIDPQTAALAREAQGMGINIRPDMLSNNRIVRMIGETLENVPLSGSQREERQIAFNRAIMGEIGADVSGKRLTPDVFDAAMTKSGEAIGDIAKKTNIPVDPEFDASLKTITENAQKFETSDVAKIVSNYVGEIRDKGKGGIVPGEAFRKISSKIGRQRRNTTNGDLKFALGELEDSMHDALEKNISSPEELKALTTARRQYAIGKSIEPLVAKSETGDISAASLMASQTSDSAKKAAMARGRGGKMGNIARVGQRFLKEPRSSGTAERSLGYGILGGAGVTHPVATAGLRNRRKYLQPLRPTPVAYAHVFAQGSAMTKPRATVQLDSLAVELIKKAKEDACPLDMKIKIFAEVAVWAKTRKEAEPKHKEQSQLERMQNEIAAAGNQPKRGRGRPAKSPEDRASAVPAAIAKKVPAGSDTIRAIIRSLP